MIFTETSGSETTIRPSGRLSGNVGVLQEFDFATLLDAHRGERAKKRQLYTSESELYLSFMATLPDVKVVSFDIFDTALVRYVDHPVDVFFHLEQHPAFSQFAFREPVSKLRIAAESKARAMVFKIIGSYEVNLLEIFQVFCDLNGVSREYAEMFVAAEEEIELQLCVACAPLQRLYEEGVAAGKQAVFVSDTYHGVDFLTRLLRKVGYDVDASSITASSATRKAKQSGHLFPYVLAALGVKPEEMIHLGDHPISDDERPRALGIRTILHSHKACGEQAELMTAHGGPQRAGDDPKLGQSSKLRGMVRVTGQAAGERGLAEDFWWRFGYSSAGPLTVGFCEWLEQSLRRDGMEHAYFLLRDGELLHKVYQGLFHDKPDACTVSTLDSSRRAMLLPVVELAPAFAVPSLMGGIGLRPVREYVERLGIPADGFAEDALAAGFASLDELIDGRVCGDKLFRFLLSQPVITALLGKGKIERETLIAYLEQERVTTYGKVAVVDLGWAGTIQQSLQVLLYSMRPETKMTGYYLATFPLSQHSIPNLDVKSYLTHRGSPARVCNQICSFLNLFEAIYTSAEGSVLRFEHAVDSNDAKRRIVPFRQPIDKPAAQLKHLASIHAGALAFVEDYRRLNSGKYDAALPPEAAAEEIFRVIERPTAQEAVLLGGLVHCDNLGSVSTHVSAPAEPTGDPSALLDAYHNAHWRQGLLNLPIPQTAALRTLLWLDQLQLSHENPA